MGTFETPEEKKASLERLLEYKRLVALQKRAEAERFWKYQDDPVGFIQEVLGEEPWEIQKKILRDLWEFGRLVVPSSHASGKSWVAARAVLAWVCTHPGAIAITTAPGGRQVEGVVWREIRMAYQAAEERGFKLPGRLYPKAPRWENSPSNWAQGFSTDDPTKFQGYHGDRVLIVMDEAAGIEAPMYASMQGMLTGDAQDTAALLIGNPVNASGPFYEHAIKPRWRCIYISAFDTPNVIAGKEVVKGLVTKQWVEDRRADWEKGGNPHEWQARVLGRFPDIGAQVIVPLSWFEKAAPDYSVDPPQIRPIEYHPGDVVMGLDLARFGSDWSAVCVRRGEVILHLERIHGADAVFVNGWATEIGKRYGVSVVNGDDGGLGGPILDYLRHQGKFIVHHVNSSSKARDKENFDRVRAEMWWTMRERFREERVVIAPKGMDGKSSWGSEREDVEELRQQMCSLFYDYQPDGRVMVESKAQAEKRGIRSPDLADACCLAFYSPSGATNFLQQLAPPCPVCGVPGRRGSSRCGCGADLTLVGAPPAPAGQDFGSVIEGEHGPKRWF